MSNLCIIEGCPGNTRHKKRGEKTYFYKALEDQLEEWSRVIPGDRKVKLHDRVCSRHFSDADLIKEWNFVIEDKTVTMPRGRWTLRVGAVPVKFDNYEDDNRASLRRKSKPKSLLELGGSSSDEEYEEPRRKRVKRLKKKRSPKVLKESVKQVTKNPNNSKSCTRSSEKTSKEPNGKSGDQAAEISWEKACDSFVDQLSSICAPTPTDKSDAKPAKRRRGRPRKEERRPSLGRPHKDKWRSSLVSQKIPSQKHSTRLKRKKLSDRGVISDMENENSVTVEEFVASGCDDIVDVETWTDRDSSSQVTITECIIPPNVTVKTETYDEGYENCDAVANNLADSCSGRELHIIDSCSVTSSSGDSALRQGQRIENMQNAWNYEGVVVKREECDCEGADSRCCEPLLNCEQTVLELPATPVPCDEINHSLAERVEEGDRGSIIKPCPVPNIIRNGRTSKADMPEVSVIPVSCLEHEVPKSQCATPALIPTPHLDAGKQGSHIPAPNNPLEKRVIAECQSELADHKTQFSSTCTSTPNTRGSCEELASHMNAPEMDAEIEIPKSSENQQQVEESSDLEMDFQGFSSEEEENLVSKRKYYQNTTEMAAKSTKLYFSKLTRACKSKDTVALTETDGLSPRTRRRPGCERRSSVEIAMGQLGNLNSMLAVSSKKPADHTKVVKDSVWKIKEPSFQERKVNESGSLKQTVVPDLKHDEVLKCGRISNEVTVTKASNLKHGLDKVPLISNPSHGLDKVTSSSNHVLLADKSNVKTYSLAQSSMGGLISNKVTTHVDRSKDKVTPSTNLDLLKDKVTTSLNHRPLQDKVTISSNHELSRNKGISAIENRPVKDKIPSTYSGSVQPHLLNGSSLDRIIESAKGHTSSLLDNVSSTSTCDPTVDKTSLILKNFKSDGVLALECVVLKEQVRQLQKELFLHKQMLIDSEHNASLLQRKLELQAQLPCVKCVNFKRGFIGKETLI